MPLLHDAGSYDAVRNAFRWEIPDRVNMAEQVCDRHADATPDATGLIVAHPDGTRRDYTWRELRHLANKMANFMTAEGVSRGDRVGILLSQSVEAAISHVGAWKMGAISIPLFSLFGEEALAFRLMDSGARVIVTETVHYPKIKAIRDQLPELKLVLLIDGEAGAGTRDLWQGLDKASDSYTNVDTASTDPSYIVYTSGTTGNPKGALQGHRSLLGHMPAVEFFHDFLPQPDDLMWTPADWAWIGGLMNCLMGAWFHGVPVLAYRAGKYDPEAALRLMAKYQVRNTFMPPTALKMMRAIPDIPSFGVKLRTIACAGEPMGVELLDWGRQSFGLTFNEFYGQTECNLVVANCQKIMDIKPGSMGRPIPGHDVRIIDNDGNEVAPGTVGQIAVKGPDPVMMLEYWNNPEATKNKYLGDWLLTGDQGQMDEDGYLWFVGRDDDVITSSGYRIGPGEIEDCLTKHPAVELAAAVGVPDPLRTEVIKVFIKLMPGHNGSPELEEDIRAFVKTRLSPHEYPRIVAFVDELPLTSTGKIMRKVLRDREIARLADKSAANQA
ncbi:MAG: acyl-CoA synthetase [Rhodospirillales bacterium]